MEMRSRNASSCRSNSPSSDCSFGNCPLAGMGKGSSEQRTAHRKRTVLELALDILEQMGQFHPEEPHWYLPTLGVDPIFQNCGQGSALLRKALKQCDEDGLTAYLESSNPRNIPLYERHGFPETRRSKRLCNR